MQSTHVAGRWQVPFFAIWTGQAFSMVGSRLVQFALVWWLTSETGSGTILATATLLALLPGIVLGPFAGALVDRWNRRRVMIMADGFVALASAWLVYLFWSGSLAVWHIYVAMFARALGEAFHWPAMQASTSLMVPERHLSRVAGINQTLTGTLNIVGPPLGALAISLLPLHGVMAVDVGTAAIAILPLLFVAVPQPDRPASAAAGGRPTTVWQDLVAGLRYAWAWPGLMVAVGMAMIINFVTNPGFALMPLLVTEHFEGGAVELGWLESAWGVGMLSGALLLSTWGGFRRRVYTSLSAMIVGGVGIAVVGLAPASALPLAMGGMFLAGFSNPLINGPLFAILQATVAPDMQGRILTLVHSVAAAMMPLSLAIAGPVADVVGVQPWYLVGGVLFSLVGLGGFFIRPMVNIEQNGHAAAPSPAAAAAAGE